MAMLVQFIAGAHLPPRPPPPQVVSHDRPPVWSIASMSYSFGFPLSCDVDVVQTLVMNYTYGNFSDGILVIPQYDYDSLQFERVDSDNVSIEFSTVSDASFHRIHYWFPPVTAPCTKTFIFTYTAIQATKTFSRSGSSKNSFSWQTINSEIGSRIDVFNVVLNFYFHTQEDSIDCDPNYSSVILHDKSTTVFFCYRKKYSGKYKSNTPN